MSWQTDQEIAEAVNAYMAKHPHAPRKRIAQAVGSSRERIGRLHAEGLVKSWPKPLPPRIAGALNSRKSNWHNFRISTKGDQDAN